MRHEADYVIPTEHHNPMELYASTVVWDGNGRLTVYDKTQGVQNVHKYLCSVFDKKPEDIRVRLALCRRRLRLRLAAAVSGGAGNAWRARAETVGSASC